MTLMNRQKLKANNQKEKTKSQKQNRYFGFRFLSLFISCFLFIAFSSCGVYTFHDVSVDYSKIKTARVGFIDNKARYINPQLSPKVTDALKQKINSYTKLTLTNSDDANYQISGYISRYDVTTSAISSNQSVTNRLTVAASITFINTVDNKTDNFTVSRDFDFPATQTLQQAENSGTFQSDIISQLTDEIFNHIFSNW